MFDAQDLFKKRLSAHIKEMSRYLRYIFNGHLAIVLFFLISVTAVYYQQWLAQLPDDFPSVWIIGITFGLIISYAPISTLLQEPDLVFLIPAEHKMNDYFKRAIVYSFISQLLTLLFIVAALSPLYFHSFPERGGREFLLTLLIVLVFKAWNLVINWCSLKMRNQNIRWTVLGMRLLLNCVTFLFIIQGELFLALMTTLLLITLFIYIFNLSRQQASVAWDILVDKDQNRMQLFYRIANMFTDVPHLKSRIKKRSWLVRMVSRLPLAKKFTYDYLYRITFIRSGDYLGMYIRLMLIGGLFIYLVPNDWLKMLFALLFIYMSCFQMMTLYQHYRTNIWIDLYPVDQFLRRQAITKWIFQLTFIQTILFAFVFVAMQNYVGALLTFIGGTLFTIIFINGYAKSKFV